MNKDLHMKYSLPPPKGLLLHGPSGVGKSALAIATINAMGLACVYIDSPSIRSHIVGESEARIEEVFRKARSASPCVLLIDQVL